MSDIILTTINARFIHTAFGLRYLYANLGSLQDRAEIVEFENSQRAKEIAEKLLLQNPRIIGFGVYIWNRERTEEVVSILKKINPDIIIILGGPEVSYEYAGERLTELSDFLILGEGDEAFRDLCASVLQAEIPSEKIIRAALPDVSGLKLPYHLYSDDDIANRVIYVEVSRGCPFTCEFCLSSVSTPVRQFDCESVLQELDTLYERGARSFKFVDRTFNLNIRTSSKILRFFLERLTPELFVHFEMVPDRFPEALRTLVQQFPPGVLQLEIGVQSLDPEVGVRISRRQDFEKLVDNLHFLRTETNAHLHVDLIVGLPGEDLESFGKGFDRLISLNPQEIQVGILKRLRGTPIVRHVDEFGLVFNDVPPYEVLKTRHVSFEEIQRMERFARFWDLIGNSGNFIEARDFLWREEASPFAEFLALSDWLYRRAGRQSSIQLKRLVLLVFEYFVDERKSDRAEVGALLGRDYTRTGRTDLPQELKAFVVEPTARRVQAKASAKTRQLRVVSVGGDKA